MNPFRTEKFLQLELSLVDLRYYIFTLLFVGGNVLFPYLVHTIPMGGLKFLPIYFFVLVGAYKFGWRVGITTAVLSPIANNLIFGMPPNAMLPIIFVKGIALAVIAAYVAHKTKEISIQNVAVIILGYQLIGFLFELVYTGSLKSAVSDMVIGYPGLLIQLILGYLIIKAFGKYAPEKSMI